MSLDGTVTGVGVVVGTVVTDTESVTVGDEDNIVVDGIEIEKSDDDGVGVGFLITESVSLSLQLKVFDPNHILLDRRIEREELISE